LEIEDIPHYSMHFRQNTWPANNSFPWAFKKQATQCDLMLPPELALLHKKACFLKKMVI